MVPRLTLRIVVEVMLVALGSALILWAVVANQQWFDRHFLPAFSVSRTTYVWWESVGRVGAAVLGASLAIVIRPRAGRFVAKNPAVAFSALFAFVMAVVASEVVLGYAHRHAAVEEPAGNEPRRRLDPQLGWTFVPSRVGTRMTGGRIVEYAIDSSGYRVRRLDEPIDPVRPTIVFTGESMIVGEGLMWDESVPAQTGAILGVQSANLAVLAYATDQAYMRLRTELPRFRQPIAVVSIFTPAIFDRNLDDDRPHLGEDLEWLPATSRWRLVEILRLLVRYREPETIDRGIAITRKVLQATCDLARARGATPLIVVPQFMREEPGERAVREQVFDGTGLPVVRVDLDATWRIPGDGHPDARAAHAIAVAITTSLHGDHAAGFPD